MNNLFFIVATLLTILHVSTYASLEKPSDIKSSAAQGFQERWDAFQGNTRSFPLWTPNWKEEELKARFDQMTAERWSVYFTNPEDYQKKGAVGFHKKLYQCSENWKIWGSRYPYPGSFSYNLASPSYNASIITICGTQFLAMEAPTKENQQTFYDLLTEFKVTDLIRLTPAAYENREASFPYWEGNINIHPKTARPTIELNGRELNYFCTDR